MNLKDQFFYVSIGVACVIGLLSLTRTQYITEFRACEIARSEVQTQVDPIRVDLKDVKNDVKEILKRVK